jgi:hypothetical protein
MSFVMAQVSSQKRKHVSSLARPFVATLDDVVKGSMHGLVLGTTGAYFFGPMGATLGFASGVLFNIYTSPSSLSWKKFVSRRIPDADVKKTSSSFSWKGGAVIAGSLFAGLALSKKGASDFFDLTPLHQLQEAMYLKQQGASGELFDEYFFGSLKETGALAWKLSWAGYMAFHANKILSSPYVQFTTKNMRKFASSLKIPFDSPQAREEGYRLLAQERHPEALYFLQKSFVEQGKSLEALASILHHYFKDGVAPVSPYASTAGRKELIGYELQHKPTLDLFVASLLLPVGQELTKYYASLALADAKQRQDVAQLSLLATYQSYVGDAEAQQTWKQVATLSQKNGSLEERILGEGNSGGASQLLFSGATDDPLRWSIVTSKGDTVLLQQKFDLAAAVHSLSREDDIFSTPFPIALYHNNSSSRLFRQQLWGLPLDEYTCSVDCVDSSTNVVSLYGAVIAGISQLQSKYALQSKVPLSSLNLEEKFLNEDNLFYDADLLCTALDWLPLSSVDNSSILASPIVDPYVRNIGVHKKTDGIVQLSFWDIEPKGKAPALYDLATLLLTAKPYLTPASYASIRSLGLSSHQHTTGASLGAVTKSYVAAVTLRSIALLKAWSNELQQPRMLSQRSLLLDSARQELLYASLSCDDERVSSFAQQNISAFSSLKNQLPLLAKQFSV